MNSLIPDAMAQTAGGAPAGPGGLPFFAIMAVMIAVMYFLMIRPQRRKMRAQTELQSSIDVGDEVMTTSGLYGFVTLLENDIAWLEIDDNVQIRIARQALQRKVDTSQGETAVPNDDGSGSKSKIEPTDGSAADEPSQ